VDLLAQPADKSPVFCFHRVVQLNLSQSVVRQPAAAAVLAARGAGDQRLSPMLFMVATASQAGLVAQLDRFRRLGDGAGGRDLRSSAICRWPSENCFNAESAGSFLLMCLLSFRSGMAFFRSRQRNKVNYITLAIIILWREDRF